MKQTTKMSRAVSQLEHIYNALNTDFFQDELPIPIITVQSKPGTYGHCTTSKVWQRKDGGAYELNIAAEVLNYPIEETLDTMLHEMVHLYCRENGIKEVSRGGKYHNKRFKAEAERRGLVCVPCGQYGWNTTPSDNLVEYALSKGWNEIKIGRGSLPPIIRTGASGTAQTGAETTGGGKRPSSTRKLQCPKCGCSVRATKTVRIMCMDCMEQMIEV
ncbi:SprT-like domain-containing protein [Flavonifractor sp. An112]|uniref:SprT-like domain-containing protein n=1 Tax=Flavonifractor sp. An112 TaxID=1965544 RepID=UPI001749A708|nr:SprT-like domain-containing protein [Flavonifractor sp. An112]